MQKREHRCIRKER